MNTDMSDATNTPSGPAANSATPTAVPVPSGTPRQTTTTAPPTTGSTTNAKRSITVVLNGSGWDATAGAEAGGYPATVESDGTSTLQLASAASTVSVSAAAQADASTTDCGWLAVPPSRLSAGSWAGVLRYQSAASTGDSTSLTIRVP